MVPYATIYLAIMGDAKKFIGSSGHVRVGRLLIGEERVGYPNVIEELGADHDCFDAWQWRK